MHGDRPAEKQRPRRGAWKGSRLVDATQRPLGAWTATCAVRTCAPSSAARDCGEPAGPVAAGSGQAAAMAECWSSRQPATSDA